MFRPASRSVLRTAQSSLAPARTLVGRRFITTEAPHLRGRSWKSSAARWGLAIAGLYYYNTSPVFAEEPSSNLLNPNVDALEKHDHSELDVLTSRRQKQNPKNPSALQSALEDASTDNASQTSLQSQVASTDTGSPADLEQEAEAQGAFNEETGEINWDCPCLGGMAHGPCGPEFREAFSCFVFSKEDPKGMDCIEKFKGMQDCFQQHPEIYKGELEDDEEIDPETKAELQKEIAARSEAAESKKTPAGDDEPRSSSKEKPEAESKISPTSSEPHPGMSEEHNSLYERQSSPTSGKSKTSSVEKFDEDLELMPKDWHDARSSEVAEKRTGTSS